MKQFKNTSREQPCEKEEEEENSVHRIMSSHKFHNFNVPSKKGQQHSNSSIESKTAHLSTPSSTLYQESSENNIVNVVLPVVQYDIVYKVQFQSLSGHYIFEQDGNERALLQIGQFVKVEADRGEDLGIIADVGHMKHVEIPRSGRITDKEDRPQFCKIIRLATPHECAMLPEKRQQEMEVIKMCKALAHRVHRLPITVLNASFQFDRNKLTIFYASSCRVDFREYVRDLFAMFKSRIWMEKVLLSNPSGSSSLFERALETGQYFEYHLSSPHQFRYERHT
mmetsp:Transcript_4018/g.5573  ORF Transcript_4018/g.5573 Transcript_4018/m.5573 type:complete len:281 (+) Transcript_4018:140-982(+)|eukprot:CAMPEP_0170078202 /NCGR_PEP_ID=MMETSP0019_2-20121128/14833_1 /TAXON_ID=98059 /ORGANISM="Dinobryon sp., Strain UTEXLB2267" /LENGTH=280 /DNA_ID=CAMNT_0010290923 /DNA_START=68 /DNA_END=910 /DNA_ORIENTATION=-